MTDAASERPFDPGLQAERTLLAWQRTCLALAVGNAVAIRYLFVSLGPWSVAFAVIGLVLSLLGWMLAALRYRRVHRGLVRTARLATDGALGAMVAASVLSACIAGMVLLVTVWRPW